MAHGYFIIEQWMRPNGKSEEQWVTVATLDSRRTLSDATAWIEQQEMGGFYRVLQMQRMVWAEQEEGKLKLRKWHAGTPEDLARGAEAFVRDGGKWPKDFKAKPRASRKN